MEWEVKQIHFWVDGDESQWPPHIVHTFKDTEQLILVNNRNIHTTSLISLDFYYLWGQRYYKVFVHKNNKVLEIYPGMTWSDEYDKEIRLTHDIRKLVLGGTFDNFFNK